MVDIGGQSPARHHELLIREKTDLLIRFGRYATDWGFEWGQWSCNFRQSRLNQVCRFTVGACYMRVPRDAAFKILLWLHTERIELQQNVARGEVIK